MENNSIYTQKALDNKGKEISFSEFKGKTLLIVNTASKCGFTPQYKGLEELYRKYRDKGLVVIGFPCNQFGEQEPGADEEIASFCEVNFGVTFPLMQKIDVNGANAHPLYIYLKKQAGGLFGRDIKWNFTKFLISADGRKIKRFSPLTTPEAIEKHIAKFIGE